MAVLHYNTHNSRRRTCSRSCASSIRSPLTKVSIYRPKEGMWDFPSLAHSSVEPAKLGCRCEDLSPWIHTVHWCEIRSGKSYEVFAVCSPRSCIVPPEVSRLGSTLLGHPKTTTAGQFAEAHKSGRTDPDKPTAVLLDLAHILPVSADVWLFKLLVVDAVRNNIGGNVYHRRRADHFYIEETGSEHFDGEWRVELQPQPEASSPSGH